jgi:hypothetical protein
MDGAVGTARHESRRRTMSYSRLLTVSVLALWLALPAGRAHATAVFSDTVLVKGPEYLTVLQLPLDTAGSYKVTATDLKWPSTPLQALSFGVFTSTQSLGLMQGAGTLEFYKAGSDKIFLQIYAKTSAPKYAGLVGVVVESNVVPLPSSLVLLVSGVAGAVLTRRPVRRQCVKFA